MVYEFRPNTPIYVQLVERFRKQIVSGKLGRGARLESVRDLATEYGVNPNTMQRALSELESTGLIVTHRTSGRSITDDEGLINDARQELAKRLVEECVINMDELGYDRAGVIAFVQTVIEGAE